MCFKCFHNYAEQLELQLNDGKNHLFSYELAPTSPPVDGKMFKQTLSFGKGSGYLARCIWLAEVDNLRQAITSCESDAKLVVLVNTVNSTSVDAKLFSKADKWKTPLLVISSDDGEVIKGVLETSLTIRLIPKHLTSSSGNEFNYIITNSSLYYIMQYRSTVKKACKNSVYCVHQSH